MEGKVEKTINDFIQKITSQFDQLSKTTADTLSWLSIVLLNLATLPSFLAMMSGLSDKLPSLDVILILWIGLLIYFIRSCILKDMLMVVTIGLGFAMQAILLGIIFFV